MKNFTLLLGFIFVAISFAMAQEVVYEGRLTDYDSKDDLSGVTVSAVANGSVVYSTSTSRRGNYTMKLPLGAVYTIKYQKNGFVTKTMKVNVTNVNEEDMPIGGRIMPPVDIELFTDRENVDFSFLEEEPVVEWDYDEKNFVMDWDRQVYNKMKKKIEDKLAEAENKEEEQEAKYNALISEADKLFDKEDYQVALGKYEEAISVPDKATEEHPNSRILEIEELLQDQAEEALAEKQANQEYQNLIDAADNLSENDDYESAIAKYNEAITLKPEEQYPKDQIEAIKAAQDKAEKMGEYTKLIERADEFFEQNSLKAARDFYQQASSLIPDEQYPNDQLEVIEKKLKEQEEQREQKDKYEKAIADADEFYSNESYEQAIEKYKEALTYESAATYPEERIKLAEEALAEQQANAEKEEQFNTLVEEADQLVLKEDYKNAIAKYDEALVITEDSEVKDKKANAEKLLAEKEAEQGQEQVISELLVSAKTSMGNEDFEDALANYQEVLTLDKNNTDAIEGKADAERAIAKNKELAEKKEEFDKIVAEADDAFDKSDWEQAKNSYQAAKNIFEDDNHVNSQLNLVAEKLNEAKEQEQIREDIQELLDQAAGLKNSNEWDLAIDNYEEALNLDESRDDIKDLLSAAKKSQEEWKNEQGQEAKFEGLKTEGDLLFAQEKWNDAKTKYEEALEIKSNEDVTANIEIIKEKLAELGSEQEQEERFETLVTEAKEMEGNDELENAISKYQEALEIKSSADVENKIDALQDEIAKAKEEIENQEAYEKALASGKKAIGEEDYASAIKFFEDALIAIPMDDEAKDLKSEAEDKLAGLRSEEEKYNSLIVEAEAALNNKQLEEAKSLYEDAQSIRPKATLPQDKIIEIDELLRLKEEELAKQISEQEKNETYQEKLELADVAAGNFKYKNAIEHLNDALEIKPEEIFPKRKIKEYQALLDQIAAQDSKEKKYNDLVEKADQAFDNKSYEESISLYEDALDVKSSEVYPTKQIAKAESAIEGEKNSELDRAYNDLISKGDQKFMNKEYDDALLNYKEALSEKPGDQYASDKIEETNQILNNLAKQKGEDDEKNKKYQEFISQADSFFDNEEYIKAKDTYEQALKEKSNDPYAIRKIQESVEKAKAKVDAGDEARYQKIVSKADEYFDEENYDKAKSLYERALKLRSYDQYPKDKLAEITAIKNGTFKEEAELEYLGEKENISIIDGKALLEKGENQRENLKLERLQKRIEINEGQAIDRKIVDNAERAYYENEITRIYDKRSAIDRIERDNKDKVIVEIDEQEYQFEKLHLQENNFERGSILRQNDNLTYISDDFNEHKMSKSGNHNETIEKVKEIEQSREELARAEQTQEKSALLSTSEQLIEIEDDQRNEIYRSEEMRADNVDAVDKLQKDQEKRVFIESDQEYQKIQKMNSDAILAELKKSESEKEKQVIHDQLRDDIAKLEGNLIDKNRDETRELYEEQLSADATLTQASENYIESQENNDEARKLAVEELKEIEEDKQSEYAGRSEKETEENQANIDHAGSIKEKQSEELATHRGDKVELNEKVKERVVRFESDIRLKSDKETSNIESTSNNIERTHIADEQARSEKSEKVKENDENVKAVEASINAGEIVRKEELNKEKLKSQDVLDKMDAKRTDFKAEIENTIGEDFPEGVTQETYISRDKDGIAYKVTTRRIVVTDGYGEVYMQIRTKNGATYSKNDRPISEDAWIRATEDADLVQHF
jgi:tetratricopeptide (TPR) repeat protein